MQTLQRKRCQTRTRPRKIGCVYGAGVSGATIFAYVGGDPLSLTDPEGLQAADTMPFPAPIIPSVTALCLSSPWACGAAAAGAGGYATGTLIYPIVEPAISKAVDWCMSSSSKQECYDKCYAAYLDQVRICKIAPTAKGRAQCYARANDLQGQCRAGCK